MWFIHALNYPYILYIYFFTDAVSQDNFPTRKIWIPLDIILTINITLYQIFYHYFDKFEKSICGNNHNHDDEKKNDEFLRAESALNICPLDPLLTQNINYDPAKVRSGLKKLIGAKHDKEDVLRIKKKKDIDIESGKPLSL